MEIPRTKIYLKNDFHPPVSELDNHFLEISHILSNFEISKNVEKTLDAIKAVFNFCFLSLLN